MRRVYVWVATVLAIYSWMIAAAWLIVPSVPVSFWGMAGDAAAVSQGRRVAVFVAGLGVALFLVRREPASRARRAVTLGFAVAWLGAAAVSVSAFATGIAGAGMLATAVIEAVAAAALCVAEFSPSASGTPRETAVSEA